MRPIRIASKLTKPEPPQPGTGVRLALFQGENPVGTPEAVTANLSRMREVVEVAARYQAQLCAFPECYTTGYSLGAAEARALAQPSDGTAVQAARELSAAHDVGIVVPYVELDRDAGTVHDSIALVLGGELAANYRKTHLYGAAERINFTAGTELPPVVKVNQFPVGLLNCYECEFPPLYQSLVGRGARLVVGPTAADHHFTLHDGNPTQVPYPDATEHIIPAMASVWRVFVAYVNRRGWETSERGQWQYRGNSGVWAPDGTPMIAAGPDERSDDTLLVADCVPDEVAPFSPEGDHFTDNRVALREELLPVN
ncbi:MULTISPECIES: nitrilase-related carbon-nitrogen hydrolase [unclassified Saccharopolyspora]|uniref:nitrilase-related carbon-nitrogen hydrolase n=1 Tax=unclassified Saccharopolyspora TaxID=2646250 RepID=UPI001CD76461|nr:MULTISPECIES: nitrilase-related carbon-nitrogen hydrolase [unclassified Saccharopolyspora]MCA1186249.1 carbon-nitrogen hydrolase [Saccharopolyspora sp. 6T]MCA1192232.1 carbon-nitrogen hydrolase [Saccharopolyspora sp. 6V]MCA1227563.1 carbon-nitrogen hydrolase [Saccharopolyspora sp. 6M]MCA1281706.1 carbon-nitrogen hydrolase [Saccharopolyspora sp. 7B]